MKAEKVLKFEAKFEVKIKVKFDIPMHIGPVWFLSMLYFTVYVRFIPF